MELDVIYQGDCIEYLKNNIPSESVDLIVTDPPYLMNYKSRRRKDKNHKFGTVINGDDDPDLIREYICECFRVLKADTAMYMFCNVNKVDIFKQYLEYAGFKIKNMIIWEKNNHTAGDLIAQYGKKYEIIFYVNKGRCPIRGGGVPTIYGSFQRSPGKLSYIKIKSRSSLSSYVSKNRPIPARSCSTVSADQRQRR